MVKYGNIIAHYVVDVKHRLYNFYVFIIKFIRIIWFLNSLFNLIYFL